MGPIIYFNYNIVIIALFLFLGLLGFYQGLLKTSRLFVQLLLTFILIEILNTLLIESNEFHNYIVRSSANIDKVSQYIYLGEKKYFLSILFIYLIVFVVVSVVVYLIYLFFKPSSKTEILNPPKRYSKITGLFLNLVNAYLITPIILILFMMFIPIQNKGMTNLIINNPVKYISVSKYAQFNLELDNLYLENEYIENLLNGEYLLQEINYLKDVDKLILEQELIIENNIIPLLNSEDSKRLILDNKVSDNIHYKGYTYSLASKVDYHYICDEVLKIEKKNTDIELFRETFKIVKDHQDYILFLYSLNDDINNLTYDEIIEKILNYSVEDKTYIYGRFNLLKDSVAFLWLNYESYQDSYSDLFSYLESNKELFSSQESLKEISNKYSDDYSNQVFDILDSNIAKRVNSFFANIEKYEKKIDNFDDNLKLSSRLTLSMLSDTRHNARDWFSNPLIWAYVNDKYESCILKTSSYDGSQLYCDTEENSLLLISEYIFFEFLSGTVDQDKPIDVQSMDVILNRLNSLVNQDRLLTSDNAYKMFTCLMYSEVGNSLFEELYYDNLITMEALEYLINSDNQYVSELGKLYLTENLLINLG